MCGLVVGLVEKGHPCCYCRMHAGSIQALLPVVSHCRGGLAVFACVVRTAVGWVGWACRTALVLLRTHKCAWLRSQHTHTHTARTHLKPGYKKAEPFIVHVTHAPQGPVAMQGAHAEADYSAQPVSMMAEARERCSQDTGNAACQLVPPNKPTARAILLNAAARRFMFKVQTTHHQTGRSLDADRPRPSQLRVPVHARVKP